MLLNKPACILYILCDHLTQLIHPDRSFRAICPYQTVHTEHIHGIIMGFAALGLHPLPQILIINNVVGSYKPCQIKGLWRRIQSNGPFSGILIYHLQWDMMPSLQNNIWPDLIGNHHTIIGLVHFKSLLQLPLLPHTPTGIMRIAEYCQMNLVFLDPGIHIFKIHSPDSCLVQL